MLNIDEVDEEKTEETFGVGADDVPNNPELNLEGVLDVGARPKRVGLVSSIEVALAMN
jgi:hypothetical protein